MLNIIFRVDSGNLLGTGHVFRCLNIANIIEKSNIEFICKDFSNNSSYVIQKKYNVCILIVNLTIYFFMLLVVCFHH